MFDYKRKIKPSLGIHTKGIGSGSDAKKNRNLQLMRKPKSLESFYVNRG